MLRNLLIFVLAIMLVVPVVRASAKVEAEVEAETEMEMEIEKTPIKRTIVFSMDAINSLSFGYAVENGYCPNIKWLMDNGAYYENTISVFPTISSTSDFSILTGTYPGKHGFLGWSWYNRSEDKQYKLEIGIVDRKINYDGIVDSKNWISNETETMFEVLEEETEGKAYTSALGSFSSRGADYSFLESFEFEIAAKADQLFTNLKPEKRKEVAIYTIEKMEIGFFFFSRNLKRVMFAIHDGFIFLHSLFEVAKSKDFENSLIYVWLASPDEAGHFSGGRSETMLRSYQRVDAKIGMVMYFCKWLGIENETMFVITGNHGMNNWNETFFERINKRVILPVYEVVTASGLRHIPGSRSIYFQNVTEKAIECLANEIIDKRFVDFVIYQKNDNEIIIKGKSGTSEIVVERWGEKIPDTVYSYRVLEGNDPITEGDILTHSSFYGLQIDELNEPGEPLAPIQYPDMITRILGVLYSENAPDLIVSIGVGGTSHHGDFCYEESVVPLIFAGSGIKRMKTEKMVSIVDIAPTIMKAMGFREPSNCDGRILDILSSSSNTKYALPSFFRVHLPFYLPVLRIGFSFLLQIQLIFPLHYMLRALLSHPTILLRIGNILEIKRIITIRELRAMLPDPPEYLGTYPSEVLKTFFL